MKTTRIFTCCAILALLLGNSSTSAQSRTAISTSVAKSPPIEVLNVGKDNSLKTQPVLPIKISRTNLFSADRFVMKGIAYGLAGNYQEAAKSLRLAIRLDPNHPDAHNNLGNALAEMGKLDEAIEAYRRAIALHPEEAIAAGSHNNLGIVLVEKGQWEEGIKFYCRAIRLDPNFSSPYQNLRKVLAQKGVDVRNLDIAYRQNADALGELATILYSQGQLEGALACLRCQVELNPKNVASYNNLGGVLADLGRLKEADEAFQRAIQLDPSDSMTYNNLGTLLRRQGRIEEAIKAYRQVIELPDRPGVPTSAHTLAYDNLGTIFLQQAILNNNIKTLKEGIAYLRQAKQIDANYAPAYIDLATGLIVQDVLANSGVEEAITLLQQELQLEDMPYRSTRTHVMSHYFLGFAYKIQDNLQEAIKEFTLATQLDPNFTDAQKELEATRQLLNP